MTVGGTRAKSWEFDDSGCIARLLGVLLRTPAFPRAHPQAGRGGPVGLRERKIPQRAIRRSHSHGSGACRNRTAVLSRGLPFAFGRYSPPQWHALFHPYRAAKDVRFRRPRNIAPSRRVVSIGFIQVLGWLRRSRSRALERQARAVKLDARSSMHRRWSERERDRLQPRSRLVPPHCGHSAREPRPPTAQRSAATRAPSAG
jgi:hypothetical protein